MNPELVADKMLRDAIEIGEALNRHADAVDLASQLQRIEARRAERMSIAFGPLPR